MHGSLGLWSSSKGRVRGHVVWSLDLRVIHVLYSPTWLALFVITVEALIKVPLKNNYDPQRRLVWSAKNYFGPLGAPCLERCLWIRVQLAPSQWIREVCMATLTTDELEYVIPGYRKYKCVWCPDINERFRNSSSLESRTSRAQNLSK